MATPAQTTPKIAPEQPVPLPPPRLESGDHLTREEFERRYEAMPALKKAELIEGVVYVPSPVRFEQHGEQHADLMGLFWVYRVHTPGVRVGDNTTVRLDLDNEPQPDGVMLIDPACGGQAVIDSEGYIAGAPELAAEIAASSASLDLNLKLRVYRRSGVQEYVVWRVPDGVLDWFVLKQGRYERLTPTPAGVFQSETIPGLWLDGGALTRGDQPRVYQVLHEGLASPEHAAFVARLQQARAARP
jgi:hypothetical protein